jgi:hypothetical protein
MMCPFKEEGAPARQPHVPFFVVRNRESKEKEQTGEDQKSLNDSASYSTYLPTIWNEEE